MKLTLLFLLVVTLEVVTALSQGEKTAITEILQEWPFLNTVSPPWTSNASVACDAPFKGLKCSDGADQHILSLYDNKFCFFQDCPS